MYVYIGGWRRSGDYIYKPDLNDACCKQYTIRLNCTAYKMNKKQRQVNHRFHRYLNGEYSHHDNNNEINNGTAMTSNAARSCTPYHSIELLLHHTVQQLIHTVLQLPILRSSMDNTLKQIKVYPNKHIRHTDDNKSYLSTNAALVIHNQLKKQAIDTTYTLNDLCNHIVELCNTNNDMDYTVFELSTNGYINITTTCINPPPNKQHQISVSHNSKPSINKVPAHTFTITHHPAKYTDESFALYKQYQIAIHHDPPNKITKSSYVNFLCTSPLVDDVDTGGNESDHRVKYGSYHTHYRIDNKLVAVGVIDILPLCLSSVYVYYDPLLSEQLSLGTLTALYEIEYIQNTLNAQHPTLQYYYMGYYIHNCIKMKYKAQYQPSELLCLKQYTWHQYDQVKYALDQTDLVLFSDAEKQKQTNDNTDSIQYQYDMQSMQSTLQQRYQQCQQWIIQIKIIVNHKLLNITQIPSLLRNTTFVHAVIEYLVRVTEPIALNVAISLD